MKTLLLTLSLSLITTTVSAQSETLTISSAAEVIEASYSYATSGCSDTIKYLGVVKLEGESSYIVANNLGIDNEKTITLASLNDYPRASICQMMIKTTTKAKFVVRGPGEIELTLPSLPIGLSWRIKQTEIK